MELGGVIRIEFRKLIKFGNSSHVISLPQRWLKNNNLNKGNLIYLTENGNGEIILSPQLKEEKEELKEITINVNNKDMTRIKREIVSSYLNGYNTVKIVGSDLSKNAKMIGDEIHNLMAFEIMEQTKEKMIIRDFLNMGEISIKDLVRKMDIITRTIISDLRILPEVGDHIEEIINRDKSVNRIYFVIIRMIRHALEDANFAKKINLTQSELSVYWNIAHHIEGIADEVKKIVEIGKESKIPKNATKDLFELFCKVENDYSEAMKSYYSNDTELAYNISKNREILFKECERIYQKDWNKKGVPSILERIKDMIFEIHEICRRVYS